MALDFLHDESKHIGVIPPMPKSLYTARGQIKKDEIFTVYETVDD